MASGLRVEVNMGLHREEDLLNVYVTFSQQYTNAVIGGMCDWNNSTNHKGELYRYTIMNCLP